MCLFATEPHSRRSRAFISVSMMCLVAAILWQNTSLARDLSPALRDFFEGMFFGLSIAFSIGSIVAVRRNARRAND
jgi:hypothetical protein